TVARHLYADYLWAVITSPSVGAVINQKGTLVSRQVLHKRRFKAIVLLVDFKLYNKLHFHFVSPNPNAATISAPLSNILPREYPYLSRRTTTSDGSTGQINGLPSLYWISTGIASSPRPSAALPTIRSNRFSATCFTPRLFSTSWRISTPVRLV